MVEDIVSGLMRTIRRNFNLKTGDSELLKKALVAAKNNKATYADASNFAVEVGRILADVLSSDLSSAVLPEGKLYYNIGSRILNETLKTNYDLVTGYTADVQAQLNARADIGLKVQTPAFNQDRVDGIVNRLSSEASLDDASWMLKEPIVNFTQSIVDDSVRVNADFQSKAGLHPTITRRLVGKGCKWCRRLAGTYEYKEAPRDIYRRHENDRCIVEYDPGSGKRQNVWTKKWKDPAEADKIKVRKELNPSTAAQDFVNTKHSRVRKSERQISNADIQQALDRPIKTFPLRTDKMGRKSQKIIGKDTTVIINPETKAVITTYPTSERKRKLYENGGDE